MLDGGRGMIMRGDLEYRPVYAALWDPDTRVAEMDRVGVGVQIMCATPALFGYDAPGERQIGAADVRVHPVLPVRMAQRPGG